MGAIRRLWRRRALGLVNGVDDPQVYTGSAVSAMTVSGPADVTKLVGIQGLQVALLLLGGRFAVGVVLGDERSWRRAHRI